MFLHVVQCCYMLPFNYMLCSVVRCCESYYMMCSVVADVTKSYYMPCKVVTCYIVLVNFVQQC